MTRGCRCKFAPGRIAASLPFFDEIVSTCCAALEGTQHVQNVPVPAGTRLPFSPKFSANISMEDESHLVNELRGVVGATVSYVGQRIGVLTSSPTATRPNMPAHAKTDVYLGVKYQDWTATVFGDNFANRRGILNNGYPTPTISVIVPRTIGLSISKVF
jgi:iron complex outermembrane receptor protein